MSTDKLLQPWTSIGRRTGPITALLGVDKAAFLFHKRLVNHSISFAPPTDDRPSLHISIELHALLINAASYLTTFVSTEYKWCRILFVLCRAPSIIRDPCFVLQAIDMCELSHHSVIGIPLTYNTFRCRIACFDFGTQMELSPRPELLVVSFFSDIFIPCKVGSEIDADSRHHRKTYFS